MIVILAASLLMQSNFGLSDGFRRSYEEWIICARNEASKSFDSSATSKEIGEAALRACVAHEREHRIFYNNESNFKPEVSAKGFEDTKRKMLEAVTAYVESMRNKPRG